MKLLDFFNITTPFSSLRLNVFIVVAVMCICMLYLTVVYGMPMAPYILTALIAGLTGKVAQKAMEKRNE